MAMMTKDFAQSLLKRLDAGQHINTTLHEEQQLVNGWLAWYDFVYEPRLRAIAKNSAAEAGPISGAAGSLPG